MNKIRAMTAPKIILTPEELATNQSLAEEVRNLEKDNEKLQKKLHEANRVVEDIEASIFDLMSKEEEFRKREEAKELDARKKLQQKRIQENKMRAKAIRLKKVLAEMKKEVEK